jgi:hypothetical protein
MSLFNFDLRNARLVLAGASLVLGGAALAGGCGGGYDLTSIVGFCQAQAAADCSIAIVGACYGSSDQTISTDTDSCIAARSQISKCNPSGLPYHPEFADACVAQHQAVFANSQIDGATYATLRDACLPVFNKGNPQGSGCSDDSDCDVGNQLRCVVHAGKGTCQIPTAVGGGESCSQLAAQCTDSSGNIDTFYCDSGNHCVTAGAAGEKCSSADACGTGLRCNSSAKVCVDQATNGQPCHAASECAGGFCLGASSSAVGECAATLTYAFGGSTCQDFKH